MGPLSGVRILEFDGLGPVTFAGMMLADMGADVVRLGRPAGTVFEEVGGAVLHRGRPAVTVDLKSADDVAKVLELARSADAVIEGFRPGVLERLGLGPEALHAANPHLTIGRVTGWGQTGPLASDVGHDINYLALSGVLHALGDGETPPRPPLNLIGDYAGGAMMLVAGVLAGVIEARTGGKGRVVDAAMTDGAALLSGLFHAFLAQGLWSDRPGENLLDGGAPFYRCYRCRDGRDVAVGALEPRFFAALLAGLEIDPATIAQYDRAAWPEMQSLFAARFAQRDRDEWAARFAGGEACVTPVLSLAEAPEHPHNHARSTFDADRLPRPAPRFSGETGGPAAEIGDLDAALSRWA